MEQSQLAYVVSRLQSMKGRWSAVAKGSGVSVRTFSKIARGEVKDPRNSTLEKLTRWLREQERASDHV